MFLKNKMIDKGSMLQRLFFTPPFCICSYQIFESLIAQICYGCFLWDKQNHSACLLDIYLEIFKLTLFLGLQCLIDIHPKQARSKYGNIFALMPRPIFYHSIDPRHKKVNINKLIIINSKATYFSQFNQHVTYKISKVGSY